MSVAKSNEDQLDPIYQIEAVRLVEDIRAGIDQLEAYWADQKTLHKGASDTILVVNQEIQKNLQTVISDIARLYNLFTYEPSSKKCPYLAVSKERTRHFRTLLRGVNLSAISSRAARNSLEHFEERIDREILMQRKKASNPPGIIYACIFANLAMLNLVAGDRARIRAFTFDEMLYFNFGATLSLRQARDEINAVRKVLVDSLGEQDYKLASEGPGVIRPKTPEGALAPGK
jgi:hypothetical protein